jgi:hypothetical protein
MEGKGAYSGWACHCALTQIKSWFSTELIKHRIHTSLLYARQIINSFKDTVCAAVFTVSLWSISIVLIFSASVY